MNKSTQNAAGENLIFLISQPRAGSTLTQKILGKHSDIHTVSEPWLMLHPLYALRTQGCEAEYNAFWARRAVKDFLQELPNGEESYFEGLRRMYSYLYSSALASTEKRYFLDKTPRYYQIIPELYRTFPNAYFIILLRNPLAVLCSIVNTWAKKDWFFLHQCRSDLVRAPQLLLEGIDLIGKRCLIVQYENILLNPEDEISKICHKLDIDFSQDIINYGPSEVNPWKLGDDTNVYENTKPNAKNLGKWISQLDSPQVWRVVNDYLQLLGKNTVEKMGYSYEELQNILDERRPHPFKLRRTLPLQWFLKKPEEYSKWEYEYQMVRIIRAFQVKGFWRTVVHLLQKLIGSK